MKKITFLFSLLFVFALNNSNLLFAQSTAPSLTTVNISDITATTATSGGNITFAGSVSMPSPPMPGGMPGMPPMPSPPMPGIITSNGICWNTTGSPTVSDSKTSDATGTNTYSSTLSMLLPSTTYYVRAYATNQEPALIGYGAEVSFTTASVNTAPTFTSTAIITGVERSNYTYNITTNDTDGDTVSLTATTLPSWLSFGLSSSTFVGSGARGNANGTGTSAQFFYPQGLVIDATGNMYVVDSYNNTIRKITPEGVVTTFAGSGSSGSNDGTGTSAQFNVPQDITVDATGNFYVADLSNSKIRKITPAGVVTTLASYPQIHLPTGIAVDGSGTVYVTELNSKIKKITAAGVVTTLAGSTQGYADGTGTSAQFNQPVGITLDGAGYAYVTDRGNQRIRKINTTTGVVTTLAGSTKGSADGTGASAQFDGPDGITIDAAGNLYVAEFYGHKIRKVTPAGVVTTIAGSISGQFGAPTGIAFDSTGTMFVTEQSNNRVSKLNKDYVIGGSVPRGSGNYPVVLHADDGNGGTVDQSFNITVRSNLDFVTTKTVDNATPAEGETIVYTISVNNYESDDEGKDRKENKTTGTAGITLTDILPTGVTYVSDNGGGAYVNSTGVWSIASINGGATVSLNITATVNSGTAGTTITNTTSAAVNSLNTDPTTTGDSLSADITVKGTTNLDFVTTKTVDNATPAEGETIVYTISVKNNEPEGRKDSKGNKTTGTAGITLTDILPTGVTYVSDNGGGAYVNSTGVWSIASINGGATRSLNITATVNSGTVGTTITNTTTAAVDSLNTDPTTTGDSLSADITVTGTSNTTPTITSFSPLSGEIGSTVTITGTYFNTTPANNIVFFGASKATVSAATATSLTVTVPVHATYAPISVFNLDTHLTAISILNFTPTFSPYKSVIEASDFETKINLTGTMSPMDVEIADMDGDGKSDLISVNQGNNGATGTTVSVFRNTGTSGTLGFATKADFTVGNQPIMLAIGDVDGDGKKDIITANQSGGSFSVLLNTSTIGSISFATKVDITNLNGTISIAMGEINGDGKLDVITGFQGSSDVSIFKNTSSVGSVSFAPRVILSSVSNASYDVKVGDLDGDGLADIAMANINNNSVTTFRNKSTTTNISFDAGVNYTVAGQARMLSLGDLDGDGKMDIACANFASYHGVSILRNTSSEGSITFEAKVDFPTAVWSASINMGDINGDGKPDLLIGHAQGVPNLSILHNTTNSIGTISFGDNVALGASGNVYGVSIGDLDGDGKADLVNSNQFFSRGIDVHRYNPKFPDADLSGLTTTAGVISPTFASGTIAYTTANVSSSTASITVTPTLSDPNSTIEVQINGGGYTTVTNAMASGALSLNVGSNAVDVKVTAENGSTSKTYSITVTKNTTPTFTSTEVTSVHEGDPYSYSITTNDIDGDAVSIAATTLPSWLSLNSVTTVSVSTLAGSAQGSADGTGTSAQFNFPYAIAVDGSGNVYVGDSGNHRIKKITPAGVVTNFAGSTQGFADGTGTSAQFNSPYGIAVDGSGNVYVVDSGNHKIRKITPTGVVTTIAGSTQGYADGTGTSAQFNTPYSITVDAAGNLYVADTSNHKIRKITPTGVVTTIAGSTDGYADGTGTSAQFSGPQGVAVDASGNLYVSDTYNRKIRKINPAGVVTTLAGSTNGFNDGTGTAAQFTSPDGIVVDSEGNVYVADSSNHKIRKITPAGVVTTFAGSARGYADGNSTTAQFFYPIDVALDDSGNIYVTDLYNHKIRKIVSGGLTLSGTAPAGANTYPVVLEANDGNGGALEQRFTVTVLAAPTVTSSAATSITASGATLNGDATSDGGDAVTERGFVYALTSDDFTPTLAEVNGTTVIKVTVSGTTGTYNEALTGLIANSGYSYMAYATNSVGTTEGSVETFTTLNTAPTFTSTAVTSLDEGDTYTYAYTTNDIDGDNVAVTAPTLPSWLSLDTGPEGEVSTFAGSSRGSADATGTSAQFSFPRGVAVDASGNVYVADSENHRIRKITPSGVVSTFAGSSQGFADGSGTSAQFNSPQGVAVDASGNVYVAADVSNRIRKITPSGEVSTFAGSTQGSADGTGTSAQFNNPRGVAVDASGNVYVADTENHRIRKITPSGVVSTFAGSSQGFADATGSSAQFNAPNGVAVDASGNVYVSDVSNHRIRKITPSGVVSTFAGSGVSGSTDGTGTSAQFNFPAGVAVDALGNVYIVDLFNHRIRKITPSGEVSTLAGSTSGFADGTGASAQFHFPVGVAVDASGNVYVTDQSNQKIRKVTPLTILTGDSTDKAGDHNIVLEANDGNGGKVQQSFTITVNDITAPILTSSSPTDGASEIETNSTVVLTFDEDIAFGTGNIQIIDVTDGSNSFTIDVTSLDIDATISGAVLTINLNNLDNDSNYAIQIAPTAIEDLNGNSYVGITNNTSLDFITIALPIITFNAANSDGLESVSSTGIAVDLSVSFNSTVMVDYAVTGGTATGDGTDFTLTSGTLTYAPGDVTKNINITEIVADTILEADETIIITLSSPTNGLLGKSSIHTYTITNDDSASVTIADISGNEDDGSITVTATLDNPVQGGFTVDVSSIDGTATISDSDYTAVVNETLIFTGTAGEIQTFTITPTIDTKLEADETVTVSLANLAATSFTGITITDTAIVTITNDDTASVTIADVSGNEDDGNITVSVVLDNPVQGGFTVDVSTIDGTATISDVDYTAVVNETLTFSGTAGETQTFTITPIIDTKLEADETITVSLANLAATSFTGITITDTAIVTITNDDTASVTIADVSGNEDDGSITVTATLDNPVQGGFTVDVSTIDGTATISDVDYTAVVNETLTFSGTAGETQTFTITPTIDTKLEADETVTVSLANLAATSFTGITITDTAIVTITNDDNASVTIADISGNEDDGNITVSVVLDNPVQGGFTVDVSTIDGTATISGSDYTAVVNETLIFTGTAGETQTFTITPTIDTKLEADETVTVSLANLAATSFTGITITDTAIVTITNDDTASVTIADISGNEDDGNITVSVVLDNPVQGGFTVDVSTIDGTATISGSDYTAVANETLIFTGTAGETQTFTITPTIDTKLEADETVTVSLANLAATSFTGITITDTAIVTITNDDTASVTIADISGNEDDGSITVTATLDNSVDGGFTVDVSTIDGTAAISDSDYTAVVNETLIFTGTAGEIQTFTITPSADITLEADETLTIVQSNLSATTPGVVITDEATVTINNDDATQVTLSGDISAEESDGVANLIATLSNPVQGGFVLNITTADGTAIATSDYTSFTDAAGATFVGTAGEIQTIAIPITDDMIGESTESFTVTLTSVSGTTVGGNITTIDSVIVTIIDDDAPLVSSVSVPANGLYAIGDHLDFTVTFTNAATTTGVPSIPVIIGTTTVQAVLNGAITESLTADFRYTVVESDLDVDGIALGAAMNLNGGTILGITSIPAILNLNNIGNSSGVTVDGIRPTVVVSSSVADPTNAAFTATFTFSENVTGFNLADITISNGTAGSFTAISSTEYTAEIIPSEDGMVTVEVLAGLAQDLVNNGNIVSNVFSVLFDATNPIPTISTTAADPVNAPFTVAINFTEDVFGFGMASLVVTNGTSSDFTVMSATQYSVIISPETSGLVYVDILAGETEDLATNPNDAATFMIEYDNIPPLPPQITHISDYTCAVGINMTGDNTLEISGLGIAEELAYIEMFLDGASIGTTTTITVGGFFTFDYTSVTLEDGTYSFTAIAVDKANNASPLSAPFTISINSIDSDGDGLPDFCDPDNDGNGVDDVDEDCDGDGIIDSLDTDNSACASAISKIKTYGFSPNGDGVNDGWFIEGITLYPNNIVQLFNRSGKLVFKKRGYQNDWEGISNQINNSGNGKKLPVGPYLFTIYLGDGSKPTQGWLYINY